MIRAILPLAPAAAALTLILASCDENDPVAPEARIGAAPADVDVLPPDEGSAPPVDNAAGGTAAAIPAALHGRWGMVPDDCTSTRGDAKGLLTVSGSELRFYESVARPTGDVESSGNSASGTFDFSGEGMNWSRYQSLEIQDGKLVRSENDPAASYTYVRCT